LSAQTQFTSFKVAFFMIANTTEYFSSQIGELSLKFNEGVLTSLLLHEDSLASVNSLKKEQVKKKGHSPVFEQLASYFLAAKQIENISFQAVGTEFQKRVWSELQKIPMGETRSYGQIAKTLNSSPRAVGNACRNNPILILIPCHRVVSATGIGGFSGEKEGEKINVKRWLLTHEGALL